MKKNLLVSIVALFLWLTIVGDVFAISGFVPKQIWYSKEKLIEGETVEVHTPVWNGENDPVSVKVDFYNHDTLLGMRELVIKPQELKDVFISWKVTAGENLISAKIVSSMVIVGEEKKNVSLRYTETDPDKLEIEKEKKIIEKEKTETNNEESILISEGLLPENITTSINSNYDRVDDFRSRTSDKLIIQKDLAKDEVETIKKNKETGSSFSATKTENVVKKPLAYLKLFGLSIISFIFQYKIIFYGIILAVVFYALRIIFRSFKHK